MTAVQAVQKDEVFQVESEYTSAALNTSLALQKWWKQSSANHMSNNTTTHLHHPYILCHFANYAQQKTLHTH